MENHWKSTTLRLIRRLFTHGFLTVGAILAVLAIISFVPFHSRWLDNHIQEVFEAATGVSLEFDQATYQLAPGLIRLEEVRLGGGEGVPPLTRFGKMRIEWTWQIHGPWKPLALERIQIFSPQAFQGTLWTDGGFTPGPSLDALLRFFQKVEGRQPAVEGMDFPPLSIRVEDFGLRLYSQRRENRIDDPQSPARLLVGMKKLDMDMEFRDGSIWPLMVEGYFIGQQEKPFHLEIQYDAATNLYPYEWHIPEMESRRIIGLKLPFHGEAKQMDLHGTVETRSTGQLGRLIVKARADALSVAVPGPGMELPSSPFFLHVDASLTSGASHLHLTKLDGLAWQTRIRLAGKMALDSPNTFTLTLNESHLGEPFLQNLGAMKALKKSAYGPLKGEISGQGRLLGHRGGLDWKQSRFNLKARHLQWKKLPWLTQPQSPRLRFSGDLSLTTGVLSLSEGLFRTAGLQVSAKAAYPLFNWAGREFESDTQWKGSLEKLMPLLPPSLQASLPKTKPTGRFDIQTEVSGSPPWQWKEKPSRTLPDNPDWPEWFANLQWQGDIQLEEGEWLPPEVHLRQLFLRAEMNPEHLDLKEARFSLDDQPLEVSGRLTGAPWYENNRHFTGTLGGEMDLAWIAGQPFFPEDALTRGGETGTINGAVALQLQGGGPLENWKAWEVDGQTTLTNVHGSLPLAGKFRTLYQAQAALELGWPRSVTLRNGAFRLENLWQRVDARVNPDRFQVDLQTSGPLTTYKAIVPALEPFHVDGRVGLNGRFTLLQKEALSTSLLTAGWQRLSKMGEDTSGFKEKAQAFLDLYDWDLAGRLNLQDATFSHYFMPPRLQHMTGAFRLERNGLVTEGPLDSQWGESTGNTTGSIRFQLVPPQADIQFNGKFDHLYLDEWFEKWGPDRKNPGFWEKAKLPDFQPEDKFDYNLQYRIRGNIQAQSGELMGLRFGAMDGYLDTLQYDQKKGFLEVKDVRADLYDGSMILDCWLFNYGPLFTYTLDVKGQEVHVQPLLEDLYEEKSDFSGKLRGSGTFTGGHGKNTLEGSGHFVLTHSDFMGNPIIAGLASLFGSRTLKTTSQSSLKGLFALKDNTIYLDDILLEGSLLRLEAKGKAGLEGQLDIDVIYGYSNTLKEVMGLNLVQNLAKNITSRLIKAHVGGTMQDPQVKMVPFSLDFLKDSDSTEP